MNNTKDAVEALASSELFAEICPNHAAIAKAIKWRNEHMAHVERMEEDATRCFVPCREDLHYPELWKAGSWKWLMDFFSANSAIRCHKDATVTTTTDEHQLNRHPHPMRNASVTH